MELTRHPGFSQLEKPPFSPPAPRIWQKPLDIGKHGQHRYTTNVRTEPVFLGRTRWMGRRRPTGLKSAGISTAMALFFLVFSVPTPQPPPPPRGHLEAGIPQVNGSDAGAAGSGEPTWLTLSRPGAGGEEVPGTLPTRGASAAFCDVLQRAAPPARSDLKCWGAVESFL